MHQRRGSRAPSITGRSDAPSVTPPLPLPHTISDLFVLRLSACILFDVFVEMLRRGGSTCGLPLQPRYLKLGMGKRFPMPLHITLDVARVLSRRCPAREMRLASCIASLLLFLPGIPGQLCVFVFITSSIHYPQYLFPRRRPGTITLIFSLRSIFLYLP